VHDDKDLVGMLMLGLALAFNDLKDVEYLVYQISKLLPQATTAALAPRGQLAGMQAHLARTLCGIAHEVIELLKRNREAIEATEFQRYLKRLSREYKQSWKLLWNAAREHSAPKSRDPLVRALFFARNKVAYHYAEKDLRAAYTEHFRSADDKPAASLGETMEQTRFYYADAAALAYLREIRGMTPEQWISFAKDLNQVLYALLHQFIDFRAPTRQPYKSGAVSNGTEPNA
jgi:hypothetical protein